MEQSTSQPDSQVGGSRQKGLDEKFCASCGEIIKIKAEICPKCGVRQKRLVSKTALLLITFFFGGIGAHKFYIQKNWQGVFYLLFCWTGIPGLIALIEFIIYAFTSTEELQKKYSASGAGVVIAIVACGFVMIAIIGIIAAIAIPQFVAYQQKALQSAVQTELLNIHAAEQNYYFEHNRYATSLSDLGLAPAGQNIVVEIVNADGNCFIAKGMHTQMYETFWIDCNGQIQQE